MQQANNDAVMKNISILIVDDSLVFRKFLEDIFEDYEDLTIIGEAKNGIEALEMVLDTKPDVILLDMEMPLMDGMTALQHMMIHRPTPTIMFSSLTEEGTARCFDTMKNGALDFVCKDFIFQKKSLQSHKKLIIEKVRKAAHIKLQAREPAFSSSPSPHRVKDPAQQVVFCEECGNREILTGSISHQGNKVICSKCGDSIDLSSPTYMQYRRNTFITVLGGGEGSFFNLLEIVPKLSPDMGGALIAVIHGNVEHVNGFAEYLDAISAMKVVRAREGVNIEGGSCYIVSGHDFMSIKPYSAQLTLQKVQKVTLQGGVLDTLLASVSTLFKKRTAGIILSGTEIDGSIGMSILMKNEGTPFILSAEECYCNEMGLEVVNKCNIAQRYGSAQIIEKIRNLHQQAKYDTVAG